MNELLFAVIFYSIIGLLIFKNRKKFEWIEGIVYAYRSKKPLKWMDKLNPHHWLWHVYSTILLFIDFGFMPIVINSLFNQAINIISNPQSTAGVALVIPGVKIPGSPIFIPLLYGVISIAVLAFVHEMAHGIIGKSEGIKIKSAGFGMLLIFPLFFVEPENKSLLKSKTLSRMRMIGAGAGTNIILAFILMTIYGLTIIPFLESNSVSTGVEVTSIIDGFPASNSGLTEGEVIKAINNYSVNNLTTFINVINKFKPGDNITIITNNATHLTTLTNNPKNNSLPYLGVYVIDKIEFSAQAINNYGYIKLSIIRSLLELLYWIAFLNLSIGVMNLLPINGLDGYKLLQDLISLITTKKKALIISNIISIICIALLIINLSPIVIKLFI